ncbi:UNVERIFIED_CONTAM: hypothetical protein KB579_07280 [Streptococcus canis]|uniref:hypothetical protein n=1 Tax=Streptococcus TaxID=1301 RepID=UPI0012EEF3C0|nr:MULTISPECIES: hypothetical protein [Streptococcus]HEL1010955.1 hypothetical protein [Streptococcus equi subsp. ruminatorum]QKG74534.1 hypothetical protein GE023_009765 [Streptococcus canis]QKG75353.1 hypothetical protein GE022_003460 [Streptococcus canis]GFE44497.1 hypothetical protein ScFU6_02660 [Streptococcus canis]HEL1022854.1 hypothetical protein [Streptococcus equi subsp. ruminatorum CECT 5772]
MQAFFREARVLWIKHKIVRYLQKQESIYLTYQLKCFLKIKYKRNYLIVRVDGKIKDYFDGFETDFWLNKNICFRGHHATFIAELFDKNLNDFELCQKS